MNKTAKNDNCNTVVWTNHYTHVYDTTLMSMTQHSCLWHNTHVYDTTLMSMTQHSCLWQTVLRLSVALSLLL